MPSVVGRAAIVRHLAPVFLLQRSAPRYEADRPGDHTARRPCRRAIQGCREIPAQVVGHEVAVQRRPESP